MVLHKGAATIGIVRDVDKFARGLSTPVSYPGYTNFPYLTKLSIFKQLHVVVGKWEKGRLIHIIWNGRTVCWIVIARE